MFLYLGIIDILQSYRLKKKLEHSLKSIVTDGVSESLKNSSIRNDIFHRLIILCC